MGLIKVELDNLMIAPPTHSQAWAPLQRFLKDMDADVSSFFHLPEKSTWREEIERLQPVLANRIPEVDTFIHLGIGGSSLGAEALVRALAPITAPIFHFFDNIDPDFIHDALVQTKLEKALLYVVTKSGTTMETLAQFALIQEWLEQKLGKDQARKHLVFCTDPHQGALRALAKEWDIPAFDIPPNLGGRFSVLGAVGLLPALVAGIDTKELLRGAADYRAHLLEQIQQGQVPIVADLAHRLVQHNLDHGRNITVLMPYSQKLKSFSSWFTQLWAESLGKNGKGMTPVPAIGATDQHSILQLLCDGPQDKVVGFIEVTGFKNIAELKWTGPKMEAFENISGITLNQLISAELNATRSVLSNNKRPHFTIALPKLNAHALGQLFYFFEVLTALAGYDLGIDPFDQPGVEEGKKITQESLRAYKKNSMI